MESMEIDNVSEAIKCMMCKNRFTKPVQLPCGESVCQSHLNDFNGVRKFKCELCTCEHDIPLEGFPENRAIQRMLQANLDKQDTMCHNYKNAKISFDDLYSKLKIFESIQNDPNSLIEGYFNDLINRINESKSTIYQEIDNHYNELIEQVDLNMKECINSCDKNKLLVASELDYFKNEVGKEFKMIDLSETKWKDIELKSKMLTKKIEHIIKETINQFLLNKSYEFMSPQVTLGYLNVKPIDNSNNELIAKINSGLIKKLNEGSWHKYKLIDYDDIKYDMNETQLSQLDADDLVKSILINASQIEHLNYIKHLEMNSKQIKNYILLRKEDIKVSNQVVICVIYKNINSNYNHEFLNNLGFAVVIKNPKFEKI